MSEEEEEGARRILYHLRQARVYLEQVANEEAKASGIVKAYPSLKALYDAKVEPLRARFNTLCKRLCGK